MEITITSKQEEFINAQAFEVLFGGAAGAERVMIRFGDEESLGYEQPFPIAIIKAEPVSPKFAEKLTHRDFLGAILNLGIERSTVGDIIVRESTAYFFVKEDICLAL